MKFAILTQITAIYAEIGKYHNNHLEKMPFEQKIGDNRQE
jgi:hypothetical protein